MAREISREIISRQELLSLREASKVRIDPTCDGNIVIRIYVWHMYGGVGFFHVGKVVSETWV